MVSRRSWNVDISLGGVSIKFVSKMKTCWHNYESFHPITITQKTECSVREVGKVSPEFAILPPEDIRDQEFGKERWQWWEPGARRNMTDDVRQHKNILVKL